MQSILNYFRGLWRWIGRSNKASGVEHLIITLQNPDFEFRPNAGFRTHFVKGTRFNVVNGMDLILQERGLMADSLVIEAISPLMEQCMLWCRYNTNDLSTHGTADCILFANDRNIIYNSPCGVICDRKRI